MCVDIICSVKNTKWLFIENRLVMTNRNIKAGIYCCFIEHNSFCKFGIQHKLSAMIMVEYSILLSLINVSNSYGKKLIQGVRQVNRKVKLEVIKQRKQSIYCVICYFESQRHAKDMHFLCIKGADPNREDYMPATQGGARLFSNQNAHCGQSYMYRSVDLSA